MRHAPLRQTEPVAHIVSSVQNGCARSSTRHTPWSQKLPAPHAASSRQVLRHTPFEHTWLAPHVVLPQLPVLGYEQRLSTHTWPVGHVAAPLLEQVARQRPS